MAWWPLLVQQATVPRSARALAQRACRREGRAVDRAARCVVRWRRRVRVLRWAQHSAREVLRSGARGRRAAFEWHSAASRSEASPDSVLRWVQYSAWGARRSATGDRRAGSELHSVAHLEASPDLAQHAGPRCSAPEGVVALRRGRPARSAGRWVRAELHRVVQVRVAAAEQAVAGAGPRRDAAESAPRREALAVRVRRADEPVARERHEEVPPAVRDGPQEPEVLRADVEVRPSEPEAARHVVARAVLLSARQAAEPSAASCPQAPSADRERPGPS